LIDAGQLDQAREALDGCPEELRHWEWHYLRRPCRQGLRLEGHTQAVVSVRYSPDGRFLLTGGQDGTARRWDAKTGEHIRTFEKHVGPLTAARFTGKGQLVVSADRVARDVRIHETHTGKKIHHFEGVGGLIACDQQGKYLAVLNERTVSLYD